MFEHWIETDLCRLPQVKSLGTVFRADIQANKVGVIVTRNGEPVTLQGGVKAWIITNHGTTLEVNGEKSGNRAWVVLPAGAYVYVGKIGVYIRLENGGEVTTIGAAEGWVWRVPDVTINEELSGS